MKSSIKSKTIAMAPLRRINRRPMIDKIPRWHRGHQVGDAINTSHQDRIAANPSSGLKNVRSVVRDNVDPVELAKAWADMAMKTRVRYRREHVSVRLFLLPAFCNRTSILISRYSSRAFALWMSPPSSRFAITTIPSSS